MSSSSLVRLGLTLLLLGVCSAQLEQTPAQGQQRLRSQCRIEKLQALNPSWKVEAEAGVSEYWTVSASREALEQLECTGVTAARHTIRQKGLLLPSFLNAPEIFYVVQGKGIHGAVIPGCPETFESGRVGEQSQERHQKIREITQGDIIAIPAGVSEWVYNNGNSPLVLISFVDVGNQANQLDLSARRFNLAGNPQREQEGLARSEQEMLTRSGLLRKETEKKTPNGNLFAGFTTGLIAEFMAISEDLARKLQSQDDRRERIVRVRGEELQLLSPSAVWDQQGRRQGSPDEESYDYNGLEETFCSMKLRYNVDRQSQADIFNPRGGRVKTVTSLNLPILRNLRLTAERGVLYRNGMMAPHYNMNAHSVIYCTRGSGRVQIVDDLGRNVFDGELRQGQILVVPQNYAVVKKANSDEGFEWISVKTNDRAVRAPLAGRISVMRGMPDDVLANAFRITREQARSLKNNRNEVTVFAAPSSSSQYHEGSWE